MILEQMKAETFQQFQEIIYRHSGINLAPTKAGLVRTRIGKRIRELNLASYNDYLQVLQHDGGAGEITRLLDAVSTNVTHFFRESAHFDLCTEHLCTRVAAGNRRLRVWSAACSSGEEPYTLAMSIAAAIDITKIDLRILATDINTEMLTRCREATYSDKDIENIPEPFRDRYLQLCQNKNAEKRWQVNANLRQIVAPRRLNLAQPPFPMRGPFDIIFCRNVMIYFDNTVRKRLLKEMARLLSPGGLLMVGHSESLSGIHTDLQSVQPSVYRK